jgi:hypothetical protein
LDGKVLALMESGFGHDFSRVRVHADADAARSAHALGARAYTVGEDVVFGHGAYDPNSAAGRRLIAHELAHVVQQSEAPAAPARAVSSPRHPSEGLARSAAERVAAGASAPASLGAADARVLREVEPGWQDAGPSPPPAPTTNVLQEFDVDRKKGGKPWNLDKLTKQIGEALAADKDRYIEVVGYWEVSEEQGGAGDAPGAAERRADVVRRALLQWIPTLRGRLTVTIRDRDLWRELGHNPTRRQVGVEWATGPIPPRPGPLAPGPQPLSGRVPLTPDEGPLAPGAYAGAPSPGAGQDAFRAFVAAPASGEVEPGSQDGGQGQGGGWSIDPSPPPAPTTNVLQEFDVDRKKRGKPWNLDKLTRQIGEALAADKDRYIEVVGYYDVSEEQGAGDARDAAKKRADVVRRALLQWIPTLKGRLKVTTRDRDLWREFGGDPTRRQVGVEWGPFGLVGGAASPLLADPSARGAPGVAGAAATVSRWEYVKAFFGDGIVIGKDVVTLSIKGITPTLYEKGPVKATLTAGWTATATFKLAIHRWHLSTSLSPTGSWEVRLSFPRETWVPDATRLKAIMDRGTEAALAIGKTAIDPAFYQLLERAQKLESIDDFKAIGDRIAPYVGPIRYTIEAAQGMAEAEKGGGPSFGLSAGSGTGPGGRTQTPEESAAGAPKGAYVQGVLTWTF